MFDKEKDLDCSSVYYSKFDYGWLQYWFKNYYNLKIKVFVSKSNMWFNEFHI